MEPLLEIPVDAEQARIYEHGWQSWSPACWYRLDERPIRPGSDDDVRVMNWRPERRPPADAFQGEGLLAVDDGTATHVFAAPAGADPVPSVRAQVRGDRVLVSADGPVEHAPGDALEAWADRYAAAAGVGALRPAPTLWCSWYEYFTAVTQADMEENLAAMDELALPVDVVQLDDGFQAEIGDWLVDSGRFGSLEATVAMVRGAGRRAGIWVAPFLVGPRSALAAAHPDWLVPDVDAGVNWGQRLRVLDATHPGAEAYLREVFATLHGLGIDLFKLDFVYAGAIEGARAGDASGLDAYRHGLRVIRDAVGPDAYLLGCGAPILPSVGLVDAMRIGPDIAAHHDPEPGNPFGPSQYAATVNGAGRAFQHGRFWVNDPDCLIARPAVERREAWAAHVERFGGLRASSDRLRGLDEWGLDTTRRLLRAVSTDPF